MQLLGEYMKEIKNWTVVFEEETGKRGIGILLPGCIVKGIIIKDYMEQDIEIEVLDVDITNLIITSNKGEQYKLIDVSREYLQDLQKCIQIGLKQKEQENEDNVR